MFCLVRTAWMILWYWVKTYWVPPHNEWIQMNLIDVLQGVFIHAAVDQINRRVFCILTLFENLFEDFSQDRSSGFLYFLHTFLQAFFCLVIIFVLACAEHFSFFNSCKNHKAIFGWTLNIEKNDPFFKAWIYHKGIYNLMNFKHYLTD